MKECASCGSNEIVKNLQTGQIFCYDCKSEKVYGNCYQCGKPIKEKEEGDNVKLDGGDGWHHYNKIYGDSLQKNIYSCWEEHKIDQAVEADCS